MVVMEVSVMSSITRIAQRAPIGQLDEGEWLHRLLADVHEDVVRQPSPAAITRIRHLLMAQIKAPARVAA